MPFRVLRAGEQMHFPPINKQGKLYNTSYQEIVQRLGPETSNEVETVQVFDEETGHEYVDYEFYLQWWILDKNNLIMIVNEDEIQDYTQNPQARTTWLIYGNNRALTLIKSIFPDKQVNNL